MIGEVLRILVDADACPVKVIVEEVAADYHLDLILVVNPHHQLESRLGQIVRVDGGSQAVDLALANLARSGDIVVTQDYGLACMVMAKHSRAIHPNGWIYEEDKIDSLLMQRHINAKARRAGFRTTNPKKRISEDNRRFRQNLIRVIEKANSIST
ncbi:MAG: YaiI/YqxD family protein [Syntrophomonas sp.]